MIMSAKLNFPFAVAGDSGALVYDPDGDPLGMIWGLPVGAGEVDILGAFYTPFDSIMLSLTKAFSEIFGRDKLYLEYTR